MVKCANCGFLASRNDESDQWGEVGQDIRNKGIEAPALGQPMDMRRSAPICFMRSSYIPHGDNGEMLAEMQAERECPSFAEWRLGFSPKEHREMMDRKWMQKWQAEREEADRKWREQQEAKHSRQEWLRYIFIGVVGVVSALVGAWIARAGH